MRSAVDRIFDLLEAIATRPAGAALNELAAAAQLAKPTAHRLLADLIARGLVRQDGPNGDYSLTLEIALLGFRHLAGTGFLDICQPALDRLAGTAGELIRLSWLDGERLAIVAESQGAKPGLRFDANLGRPVVLHSMAVGKAYLASLTDAEALARVRAQGLLGKAEAGASPIRTEADLLAELERVRRCGHALAYNEADPGAGAVAVPIKAADGGAFLGAIAVVVPTARWTREALAGLVPDLSEAARDIAGKAVVAPYCRKGAQVLRRPANSKGS